MDVPDDDLTQKIIACGYAVHSKLDVRFLEKAYKASVNPEESCYSCPIQGDRERFYKKAYAFAQAFLSGRW